MPKQYAPAWEGLKQAKQFVRENAKAIEWEISGCKRSHIILARVQNLRLTALRTVELRAKTICSGVRRAETL